MQLDRDGLKANKTWLFTDRFVVCLGSDIKSDSALTVTTSVDQRLKHGNLEALDNGKWMVVTAEEYANAGNRKFFHDNTGYVILGDNRVIAEAGKRTGRWNDFMKMYKPVDVEGEIISIHINHGASPKNGSYGYVALPATTKDAVGKFDPEKEIKIVRNDALVQAIQTPKVDKGCWITAYTDQPVEIDGKMFSPEAPGVYYAELQNGKWEKKQSAPFRME